MPRIYDNLSDSTKLGTGLNEFLHSFDSIDVATGYFDLRGWSQLDDLVRTKAAERQDGDRPVARVLIGMVRPAEHEELMQAITQPLSQDDDGEGARSRATRIRTKLVNHLARQLSRGIPTAAQRATLQSLRSLVPQETSSRAARVRRRADTSLSCARTCPIISARTGRMMTTT